MLALVFVLASATGPVAVMPFQNLSRDPALAWLEAGIAETMISDLKKSRTFDLVERSQIDRAMAELSLSEAANLRSNENATRIGRMVGARTIVVGAFQKAGRRLRLTARFVDVESGVILGTAKATGSQRTIFSLQDQIADALLGKKRAKKKRRRNKTKRNLDAYRVYAMSLDQNDSKRLGLLRRAIEIDPGFHYAKDDLDALKKRITSYNKKAGTTQDRRGSALLATARDPARPGPERLRAGRAFIEEQLQNRRYFALRKEVGTLVKLGLKSGAYDLAEGALYASVLAEERTRRTDRALQLAEGYLRDFPAGRHYREVEGLVHRIDKERSSLEDRRREFEADKNDRQPGTNESDQIAYDWAPCIAGKWARLANEILEHCSAFGKRWRGHPEAAEQIISAQAWMVWAAGQEGDFADARRREEALLRHHPRALEDNQIGTTSIRAIIDSRWPTDVP